MSDAETARRATASEIEDARAALETRVDDLVADRRTAIEANDGLLARESALYDVVAAHPQLGLRRWLLSAAILLIDLMPALLTILAPPSAHDLVTAAHEQATTRRHLRSYLADGGPEAHKTLAHILTVEARTARHRAKEQAKANRRTTAPALACPDPEEPPTPPAGNANDTRSNGSCAESIDVRP